MTVARQPTSVAVEVARYRAGTADLLARSVSTTRDLERSLGYAAGVLEATVQPQPKADTTAPFRKPCTGLFERRRRTMDAVGRVPRWARRTVRNAVLRAMTYSSFRRSPTWHDLLCNGCPIGVDASTSARLAGRQ